jgi:hypothetical protein
MGTRLPVALTQKRDGNTKWAKQEAEDKRETPLALPRADHSSNYSEENPQQKKLHTRYSSANVD